MRSWKFATIWIWRCSDVWQVDDPWRKVERGMKQPYNKKEMFTQNRRRLEYVWKG